jgi:hypothetical protein
MQKTLNLPAISELRRITQSLAMLDAILSPEWEYRYYSFNDAWSASEAMASMRNGSGDDWFLLFSADGAAMKGFAHEFAEGMALPKNIQVQVPSDFASFLNEPAFSMDDVTFCYWRRANDSAWHKVSGGPAEDGADEMLACIAQGPPGYQAWAEAYYEMPVALDAVTAVFAHQPLDRAMLLALNPEAEMDFILGEAHEIGYPVAMMTS